MPQEMPIIKQIINSAGWTETRPPREKIIIFNILKLNSVSLWVQMFIQSPIIAARMILLRCKTAFRFCIRIFILEIAPSYETLKSGGETEAIEPRKCQSSPRISLFSRRTLTK